MKTRKIGIGILPDELIIEIFCFIPPSEIIDVITLVNKWFNKLANSEIFWQKMTILKNLNDETKAREVYDGIEEEEGEGKKKSWKRAFCLSMNPFFLKIKKFAYSPLPGRLESPYQTKFDGKPVIHEKYKWICKKCNKEQNNASIHFQLKSDEFEFCEDLTLPWTGLFQWFYCSTCNEGGTHIIPKEEFEGLKMSKSEMQSFYGIAIFAWHPFEEIPKLGTVKYETKYKKEWERFEIGSDKVREERYQQHFDMGNFGEEEPEIRAGDKFLGIPSWVQYDQTPLCEDGKEMELLMQLDSYNGHQVGDGILHVFYDPRDINKTKTVYQCT